MRNFCVSIVKTVQFSEICFKRSYRRKSKDDWPNENKH